MTRPNTRIATASGLAVGLIAVALAVTVWSYRQAVDARTRALESVSERAASHAAEAYLGREREAMNEFLLNPGTSIRSEIAALQASFRDSMSIIGLGDVHELPLVKAALERNDELVGIFAAIANENTSTVESIRGLVAKLDAREGAVAAPLRALRVLNSHQAYDVMHDAGASSSRALLAAILAGALALSGGLGFTLYALRLVREIDSRNRRLRDLDRMKDDFVASVSHELRTPLTSIRGYLELVLDGEAGDLTDEQRQFLSIVD